MIHPPEKSLRLEKEMVQFPFTTNEWSSLNDEHEPMKDYMPSIFDPKIPKHFTWKVASWLYSYLNKWGKKKPQAGIYIEICVVIVMINDSRWNSQIFERTIQCWTSFSCWISLVVALFLKIRLEVMLQDFVNRTTTTKKKKIPNKQLTQIYQFDEM